MSCASAKPEDPVVPLMKPGGLKARVWAVVVKSRFGPDVPLSVIKGDVVELVSGSEQGVIVKTQDGKIGPVLGKIITRPTSNDTKKVETTIDFGFDEPGHMEVDHTNLCEARDKIKWNLCVLYICCCTSPEERRAFEEMLKLAVFNKISFKKFAEETGILRFPGVKSCRTYEKMFADYWQEWHDQVAAVKSAVAPFPSPLASGCKDILPVQLPDQPTTDEPKGITYRVPEEVEGSKQSSDGVPKPDAARKRQRLDINTCDKSELKTVVGAGIAARIVQRRTDLGGFKSMADLKEQVAGVGESKIELFALRHFTVVPPPAKRVKVAEEALPATSGTETGPAENKVNAESDKRWNEVFDLVIDYKRIHGVWPPSTCNLGKWCSRQRSAKRGLYVTPIKPERQAVLEAHGFLWEPQEHRNGQKHAIRPPTSAIGSYNLPGGLKLLAQEASEAGPAEKKEDAQAPRCPITHEPFTEPVLASCCGHSFERDAIMKWIHIDVGKNRGGANCPLCECPLNKRMLVPNRTLMQNPQ